MNDDELKRMVKTWRPGEPAAVLRREALWRRLWRAEIRVPLPVALAAALVLVVVLFAIGRHDAATAPQQVSPLHGFEPVSDLNARVVPDPAAPPPSTGGADARGR